MSIIPFNVAGDGPHPLDDPLRAILEALPAFVWLAAPDGALVYSNQRWLECTGLTAEQAGARRWTTAVRENDINQLTEPSQKVLTSDKACEVETRLAAARDLRSRPLAEVPS